MSSSMLRLSDMLYLKIMLPLKLLKFFFSHYKHSRNVYHGCCGSDPNICFKAETTFCNLTTWQKIIQFIQIRTTIWTRISIWDLQKNMLDLLFNCNENLMETNTERMCVKRSLHKWYRQHKHATVSVRLG